MASKTHPGPKQKFFIEIIKPSHYDDDGYVIQWVRSFIPSNSLACVHALVDDVNQRQALGSDVELILSTYDETHTVIPTRKIINRVRKEGCRGFVLLAGVQSNQFPRAADLAREFRKGGLDVAIGGFHVSGCLSMLPELPPEIKATQADGVTIFAGEGEGRMEGLLRDSWRGELKPLYNFLNDLPDLEGQVTPILPPSVAQGTSKFASFDVGRGCPFRCSFCTIINVQGRKSRHRNADDVERVVRAYAAQGVKKFFITDDNMARNKNWESIFDRLISLREEGLKLKLMIQVDTMCHKIPGFIEKAARAGCNRVFIGMESISPENLAAAKKFQNKISEYRVMLQAWREQKVLTHAGYILGFPADTPQSIERDIRTIQRELPIDILEFFILTPLPGSADHQQLAAKGEWMDPDMNIYDTEHVTARHEKMSATEWKAIYNRAWDLYYSPEHVETMFRRAEVSGVGAARLLTGILMYHGSHRYEGVHPLQCGLIRRKVRTTRRPPLPLENPLTFYPRRIWQAISTMLGIGRYALSLNALQRKIHRDPARKQYMDLALSPVADEVEPAPPSECAGGCEETNEPAIIPLTLADPVFRRKVAA